MSRIASEIDVICSEVRTLTASLTASNRIFRFPEGAMTEKDWVRQYAVKVEAHKANWESLFDRRKFNRMDGYEQAKYEADLKKKAERPLYRAWKDEDSFQNISKETYDWAVQNGYA